MSVGADIDDAATEAYSRHLDLRIRGSQAQHWLCLCAVTVFSAYSVSSLSSAFSNGLMLYWLVASLTVYTVSSSFCVLSKRWIKAVSARLLVLRGLTFVQGITLATATVWFESMPMLDQFAFGLLLCAALNTALVVTSGSSWLFIAFALPSIVALSASLSSDLIMHTSPLLNVERPGLVLSVASLIFVASMHRVSMCFNTTIRQSLSALEHNKRTNLNLRAAVFAAKKANDSKTRFLASASHDLRQPINSLALFIASLRLKTETLEQEGIVNSMAEAIESIDSQLESLLDISKLDAGIVEPHPRVIQLNEFLSQIVAAYKASGSTSGIDADISASVPIRFNAGNDPIAIKTDPALLDRIVRNLISNAIKYTLTGEIRVQSDIKNDHAVILVQDSGVGISPEELNRVFDEFYQVDNPQRDAQRGLGLGLSIVHRLCELLEIHVTFRSKVGVGTSIELTLPLSRSREVTSQPQKRPTVNQSAVSVLVLDNEVSILHAMESVLTRMGHKVKTVLSAEAAIQAFTSARYDIALIDYRLPGALNGIDVIQRFQRLDPRIRCYLVTGDSNIKQDLSSIDILYKPMTADKLAKIFSNQTR